MNNKLFFFTDCAYACPHAPYFFGAVGARDLAHVHELMGTNKIDTVVLGDTTYEGQITVGQAFRELDSRAYSDPRQANVAVYRVKEGIDLTERKAKLVDLLCQQYGWTPEAVIVHMDTLDLIPGECASSGKDMWRAWVNVEINPDPLPMFITFEGDDADNFEPTGETVVYDYNVSVDKPLTPLWHMIDLIEAKGLEEFFAEAAYVCRKATMSDVEVEGWEAVEEVYGNHVIKLWLNPDWKTIQEKAVDELNAEVERQTATTDGAVADIPDIDE